MRISLEIHGGRDTTCPLADLTARVGAVISFIGSLTVSVLPEWGDLGKKPERDLP